MTRARYQLVDPAITPYYHCICRCVRQAWLCGFDQLTGQDYAHRKQWLIERLGVVARAFAIEVCAYAVMANHYHLVVRINRNMAQEWSDGEVIERWASLYSVPRVIENYRSGRLSGPAAAHKAQQCISLLRTRLGDLSWFMRSLNEPLARWANAEDECTGRFWAGRYKTQALLDESALLTCMSYVDLNPVRAGIAETLENSDFTSIQTRLRAYVKQQSLAGDVHPDDMQPATTEDPVPLLPFGGNQHRDGPEHLPLGLTDYLQLVDWSGRAVRADKHGAIPEHLPPILQRLGVDPAAYVQCLKRSDYPFQRLAGRVEAIQDAAIHYGQHFFKGIGAARRLFGSTAVP